MDRFPTTMGAGSKPTDYDKLQPLLEKVRDLKQSLVTFLNEYEHGQPTWPTLLDQMNVLSSQIATLRSATRDKLPLLRSNSIIPMCLSPDHDPNVEQLTERRLPIFNHDVMPQMLRTKNLPEIEERERTLTINRSTMTTPNDIQARVQEFNALLTHISDLFRHTKDTTEKTERAFDLQRFTNPADTKRLLDAMNYGTGLKVPDTPPPSSGPTSSAADAALNQQLLQQQRPASQPSVKVVMRSKNR